MSCKERNTDEAIVGGRGGVKTGLFLTFLLKMEELSIYLYADGKDTVERGRAGCRTKGKGLLKVIQDTSGGVGLT